MDSIDAIKYGKYEKLREILRRSGNEILAVQELNFSKQGHIEAPPMQALSFLRNLKHINLSQNQIVRFNPMAFTVGCPKLLSLDLSSNKIDTLDDLVEIGNLKHLEKLDIRDNPIASEHLRIRLIEFLIYPRKYQAYEPIKILTADYNQTSNEAKVSDEALYAQRNFERMQAFTKSELNLHIKNDEQDFIKTDFGNTVIKLSNTKCIVPRKSRFPMLSHFNGQIISVVDINSINGNASLKRPKDEPAQPEPEKPPKRVKSALDLQYIQRYDKRIQRSSEVPEVSINFLTGQYQPKSEEEELMLLSHLDRINHGLRKSAKPNPSAILRMKPEDIIRKNAEFEIGITEMKKLDEERAEEKRKKGEKKKLLKKIKRDKIKTFSEKKQISTDPNEEYIQANGHVVEDDQSYHSIDSDPEIQKLFHIRRRKKTKYMINTLKTEDIIQSSESEISEGEITDYEGQLDDTFKHTQAELTPEESLSNSIEEQQVAQEFKRNSNLNLSILKNVNKISMLDTNRASTIRSKEGSENLPSVTESPASRTRFNIPLVHSGSQISSGKRPLTGASPKTDLIRVMEVNSPDKFSPDVSPSKLTSQRSTMSIDEELKVIKPVKIVTYVQVQPDKGPNISLPLYANRKPDNRPHTAMVPTLLTRSSSVLSAHEKKSSMSRATPGQVREETEQEIRAFDDYPPEQPGKKREQQIQTSFPTRKSEDLTGQKEVLLERLSLESNPLNTEQQSPDRVKQSGSKKNKSSGFKEPKKKDLKSVEDPILNFVNPNPNPPQSSNPTQGFNNSVRETTQLFTHPEITSKNLISVYTRDDEGTENSFDSDEMISLQGLPLEKNKIFPPQSSRHHDLSSTGLPPTTNRQQNESLQPTQGPLIDTVLMERLKSRQITLEEQLTKESKHKIYPGFRAKLTQSARPQTSVASLKSLELQSQSRAPSAKLALKYLEVSPSPKQRSKSANRKKALTIRSSDQKSFKIANKAFFNAKRPITASSKLPGTGITTPNRGLSANTTAHASAITRHQAKPSDASTFKSPDVRTAGFSTNVHSSMVNTESHRGSVELTNQRNLHTSSSAKTFNNPIPTTQSNFNARASGQLEGAMYKSRQSETFRTHKTTIDSRSIKPEPAQSSRSGSSNATQKMTKINDVIPGPRDGVSEKLGYKLMALDGEKHAKLIETANIIDQTRETLEKVQRQYQELGLHERFHLPIKVSPPLTNYDMAAQFLREIDKKDILNHADNQDLRELIYLVNDFNHESEPKLSRLEIESKMKEITERCLHIEGEELKKAYEQLGVMQGYLEILDDIDVNKFQITNAYLENLEKKERNQAETNAVLAAHFMRMKRYYGEEFVKKFFKGSANIIKEMQGPTLSFRPPYTVRNNADEKKKKAPDAKDPDSAADTYQHLQDIKNKQIEGTHHVQHWSSETPKDPWETVRYVPPPMMKFEDITENQLRKNAEILQNDDRQISLEEKIIRYAEVFKSKSSQKKELKGDIEKYIRQGRKKIDDFLDNVRIENERRSDKFYLFQQYVKAIIDEYYNGK